MPSTYAHYRFGQEVLPGLPGEVRRSVQRFRRLYDVGLHGPDLFFNYNPFMKTAVGALGGKYHKMSGREFFTRACRYLQEEPTEAGVSYLYGVLAHYCLDVVCHPYINAHSGDGVVGHTELEAEFDRYLLELDGKPKPYCTDISHHIKLTRGECVTAAGFYPPATPGNLHQSVTNMARFGRLLTSDGTMRRIVLKITGAIGGNVGGMVMHSRPNRKCTAFCDPLLQLYKEALELYPRLVDQVRAYRESGTELGDVFDKNFEGVIPAAPAASQRKG